MKPTRSSAAAPPLVQASETFALVDGALRIAVVADTHSHPHPELARRRGELGTLLRLLLTHVAVERTRIRADVGRLARAMDVPATNDVPTDDVPADAPDDRGATCSPSCGAGQVCCTDQHGHFPAYHAGSTCTDAGGS